MNNFIQAAQGVRRYYLFLLCIAFLASVNCVAYSAPTIVITEQPKELLECEGARDLKLQVAVRVPDGTAVQYQWYKDGNPVSGATRPLYEIPKMKSTYNGVYRCRIWTSSENLYTREVAVYALAKTAILSQDTLVVVPFGKNAVLNVEAHTKGYTAPFFQQGYQWWRRRSDGRPDVKLEDDARYAGTKSPKLHINRVEGDLYCSDNEGYYLEINGQCGKVYSNLIRVITNVGAKFTNEYALYFTSYWLYYGCPVFLYDTARKGKYWDYGVTCQIMGDYDSVRIEHVCASEAANEYWTPYSRVFSKAYMKKRKDTLSYYDSSLVFNKRPTSKHSQRNYTRVTFFPGGEVQESEGYTWMFYDGPVITKQPKSQTVYELETVTLSVDAESIYRLSYQWFHNGDTLYREKGKKLIIKKACPSDDGAYWVEIGHLCDTMRSDTVIIRTKSQPPMRITKQPQSIKECEGATDLTLSVSAESEFGVKVRYLWYKDGSLLKGEGNSTLKLPVLTADVLGKYKCRIWDPYTFLEGEYSEEAVVAMYPKTKIVKQDTSVIAKCGNSATLSVETEEPEMKDSLFPPTYQWYLRLDGKPDSKLTDGEIYSGTATRYLTIKSVDTGSLLFNKAGYYLEIEGKCGKTVSKLINVLPGVGIVFNSEEPGNYDGCARWEYANAQHDLRNWRYTVNLKPIIYEAFDSVRFEHLTSAPSLWYDNYGTDNVRTFTSDAFKKLGDNYSYSILSKAFNFIPTHEQSQTHKLRATFFPGGQTFETQGVAWNFGDIQEIVKQPQSMTVVEGTDFSLYVETKSDFPLTYQWLRGKDILPGEVNPSLTIMNPTVKDEGTYWVEIGSECDTIYSDPAVVIMKPKGVISPEGSISSQEIMFLAPNPVTDLLYIQFHTPGENAACFKILEPSGREVMNFTASPGEKFITWDISQLASGTYFLMMEVGGGRYIEKFLIIK